MTVSVSIPAAVEVNSLPPSNEFHRNYGMEVVRQSTDLGCWPPEDVVPQANMEMSALVHAVRNILFLVSKQCETQCALHTVLILDELLASVAFLSHGKVAPLECQLWILVASRCGHSQKQILFLKKQKTKKLPQTTGEVPNSWAIP